MIKLKKEKEIINEEYHDYVINHVSIVELIEKEFQPDFDKNEKIIENYDYAEESQKDYYIRCNLCSKEMREDEVDEILKKHFERVHFEG